MWELEHLLAGPIEMFYGAASAAAPASPTLTPDVSVWTLMANGWHDESGVVGSFTQSMNFVRVQNKTLPVAAFRAEEMQEFTVNAVDMKADTVALALHGDPTRVTAVPGISGSVAPHNRVNLTRGFEVEELAILIAGRAPYEDGEYMNFYVPKCVVSSDYETTMMLAEASKSPITFQRP